MFGYLSRPLPSNFRQVISPHDHPSLRICLPLPASSQARNKSSFFLTKRLMTRPAHTHPHPWHAFRPHLSVCLYVVFTLSRKADITRLCIYWRVKARASTSFLLLLRLLNFPRAWRSSCSRGWVTKVSGSNGSRAEVERRGDLRFTAQNSTAQHSRGPLSGSIAQTTKGVES